MNKVDVVIPTLGNRDIEKNLQSLERLPFDYELHLIKEGNSWPEAVNIGFEKSKNDIILMDDDVEILNETFEQFDKYRPIADIFGFRLLYPNGTIQHAGGALYVNGDLNIGHFAHHAENNGQYRYPQFLCHVTTSLCYIKRNVIKKLKGMDMLAGGTQFEDVDFSFRALKAGFKILYLPNDAVHYETASKGKAEDHDRRAMQNGLFLKRKWFTDRDFVHFLLTNFPGYGIYPLQPS